MYTYIHTYVHKIGSLTKHLPYQLLYQRESKNPMVSRGEGLKDIEKERVDTTTDFVETSYHPQ